MVAFVPWFVTQEGAEMNRAGWARCSGSARSTRTIPSRSSEAIDEWEQEQPQVG